MTVLSLLRQVREAIISIDADFWTLSVNRKTLEATIQGNRWRACIDQIGSENPSSLIGEVKMDDLILMVRNLAVEHRLRIWIDGDELVYDTNWDGQRFSMETFVASRLIGGRVFMPDCCQRCLRYV